jgi:hypothetical protein
MLVDNGKNKTIVQPEAKRQASGLGRDQCQEVSCTLPHAMQADVLAFGRTCVPTGDISPHDLSARGDRPHWKPRPRLALKLPMNETFGHLRCNHYDRHTWHIHDLQLAVVTQTGSTTALPSTNAGWGNGGRLAGMLPEMSSLQFFVARLLFARPQSGEKLRGKMKKAGVKIRPPSFSRLMTRMEQANYLQPEYKEGPNGLRRVRPQRLELTDLGLRIWQRTWAFYAAGDGPPKALVPITTEEGQLADRPRKERRAIIQCRVRRKIERMFGVRR